jgi:hypothetical protein
LDSRIDSLEDRFKGGYILCPNIEKSGTFTISRATSFLRINAIIFGQSNGNVSCWMSLVAFHNGSLSNNKIVGNKDMTGSSDGIRFSVSLWEIIFIISAIKINCTLT